MPHGAAQAIIKRFATPTLEAFDMAPSDIPGLKSVFVQLKTRMDKAVEDFRTNLAAARTGRASVHMLDTVRVPYYGSEMPLNQVSQVHAADAQLLTVTPYDPSIIGEVD